MRNQVPVRVARERNRVLRELASQKKLAFMQSFIGKTIDAITLKGCASDVGSADALTDNYLKLRLMGTRDPNQWITAAVHRVEDGALVGA